MEKIEKIDFDKSDQKNPEFSIFDQKTVQKKCEKTGFDPFFGTCLIKAHAGFDHEK